MFSEGQLLHPCPLFALLALDVELENTVGLIASARESLMGYRTHTFFIWSFFSFSDMFLKTPARVSHSEHFDLTYIPLSQGRVRTERTSLVCTAYQPVEGVCNQETHLEPIFFDVGHAVEGW